jgi:hypothetical protein
MGTDKSETQRRHVSDRILRKHLLDQKRGIPEPLQTRLVGIFGRVNGADESAPLISTNLRRQRRGLSLL